MKCFLAGALLLIASGLLQADSNAVAGAIADNGMDRYYEARKQALAEGKPLLVWVGQCCPACVNAMPNYLHVCVDTFPDAKGPCVVVSAPRKGDMWWLATLKGVPGFLEVRRALCVCEVCGCSNRDSCGCGGGLVRSVAPPVTWGASSGSDCSGGG